MTEETYYLGIVIVVLRPRRLVIVIVSVVVMVAFVDLYYIANVIS